MHNDIGIGIWFAVIGQWFSNWKALVFMFPKMIFGIFNDLRYGLNQCFILCFKRGKLRLETLDKQRDLDYYLFRIRGPTRSHNNGPFSYFNFQIGNHWGMELIPLNFKNHIEWQYYLTDSSLKTFIDRHFVF